MGYTHFTVEKLQGLINHYHPTSAIDLGAQNLYNQPKLPAPYASEFYRELGITYACIDTSNENGSWLVDLSQPTNFEMQFGMVVDAGTSEHIGINGKFDWEAIYNCWKTKHELLKVGYPMYSENPKYGNWEKHGFNYYSKEFYEGLMAFVDYELLELGEHPACNNITDGWNVFASMRKMSEKFPTLEQFKTLDIKQK